jgi:hypothetical protein
MWKLSDKHKTWCGQIEPDDVTDARHIPYGWSFVLWRVFHLYLFENKLVRMNWILYLSLLVSFYTCTPPLRGDAMLVGRDGPWSGCFGDIGSWEITSWLSTVYDWNSNLYLNIWICNTAPWTVDVWPCNMYNPSKTLWKKWKRLIFVCCEKLNRILFREIRPLKLASL